MSELSNEIQSIIEMIEPKASVDDLNRVVFADDAFESTLPEGVTMKIVKQVETHKQNFGIAQGYVTGKLGTELMGKNKELKEVSSTVKIPCGKSVSVVSRNMQSRNPQTGEVKDNVGYVSTRIVTKLKGNSLTTLRGMVAEMATKQKLA